MGLYLHLFSVQNALDAKQRGVRWKNIKKWQRRSFVYVRLHSIETTAVNHYSLKIFLSHFPLKDCSLRRERKGEEIRDEMSKLQAVATDHTLISVIYWEVLTHAKQGCLQVLTHSPHCFSAQIHTSSLAVFSQNKCQSDTLCCLQAVNRKMTAVRCRER